MTRAELREKYRATLTKMGQVEAGDMDVLLDKLIYAARNQDVEGADSYYVPCGFDLGAFLVDLETVA